MAAVVDRNMAAVVNRQFAIVNLPTNFPVNYSPDYLSEDIGWQLIGTIIAFNVTTAIFIALRFLSRYLNRQSWGVDDWLMIPSWIFFIGYGVANIIGVTRGGGGKHMAWVFWFDMEKLYTGAKSLLADGLLYDAAALFPRLSILYLFYSIFGSKKGARNACIIIASTMLLFFFALLAVCLSMCRPIQKLWDPWIDGTCMNINSIYRWAMFPTIAFDIALLVLPMPFVMELQISGRYKFGVLLTFATGCLGCIMAIVRFILFYETDLTEDMTYAVIRPACVTVAELASYIMAACMPTYRPLFKNFNTWRTTRATVSDSSSTSASSDPYSLRRVQSEKYTVVKHDGQVQQFWRKSEPIPRAKIVDRGSKLQQHWDVPVPAIARSNSAGKEMIQKHWYLSDQTVRNKIEAVKDYDRRKVGTGISVQKEYSVETKSIR